MNNNSSKSLLLDALTEYPRLHSSTAQKSNLLLDHLSVKKYDEKGKDVIARRIESLPEILKSLGWTQAERLINIWLNDEKKDRDEILTLSPKGDVKSKRSVEIYWDWYLSFVESSLAIQRIESRLKEHFLLYITSQFWTHPFPFNNSETNFRDAYWKKFTQLLKKSDNLILIEKDPPNWNSTMDGTTMPPLFIGGYSCKLLIPNELYASLGDHRLSVYITGKAEPKSDNANERTFTIDKFWVRVYDSFNFEGKQYLGNWGGKELNSAASVLGIIKEKFNIGEADSKSGDLTNQDFREYQAKYKKGTDFDVFSKLKELQFSKLPLSVKINLAE